MNIIGNENNVPTILPTLSNQPAVNISVSEAGSADGNEAVKVLAQNLAMLTGQNNLLGDENDVLLSSDYSNERSEGALTTLESTINLLSTSNTQQDTQAALRQLSLSQNNVDDALNAQANQLTRSAALLSVDTGQGPAHIRELANNIGLIKTNFLDVYRDITKKTTEYFSDFTDALSHMSNFINPGVDKDNPNKIIFHGFPFSESYFKGLIYKYQNNIVYTLPQPVSSEAFDFWTKKLSPDLIVNKNGGITMNVDILIKINNSVKDREGEILTVAFQALQSEVDSYKSRQQSAVTRIMDSYRQDLSTFDNLINLLMGMYATETKVNEGFLRY